MNITIIGISDDSLQYFPPEVLSIISHGHYFSGGLRHHALMKPLLPPNHQWIDVKAPMAAVYEAYRAIGPDTALSTSSEASHSPAEPAPSAPAAAIAPITSAMVHLIVFASGDPLFYGYATTLRREFPDADIRVFPTFNSLQLLAHRLVLPYQDMKCTSVTGRPWKELDDALIRGERLIGVLTDKYKTPRLIADRMLEFGYDNYTMSIGQCLGNRDEEQVTTHALRDVPQAHRQPNCIILQRQEQRPMPFGIPEADFHLLDGRTNMITKAPIRLLSLSALDLPSRHTLWDVGFCTGSISIEARRLFPHLTIESFEIRPEGEALMHRNSRRFGAPGIDTHIGDFLQADLTGLPRPDAVFIGGHGGRLSEMVDRIRQHMLPGGCIVMNAVSEQSRELFRQAVGQCQETRIALDDHNPICIMKATI